MQKQVLDHTGKKIEGVFKNPDGQIAVNDEQSLNKYLRERETQQRLSMLESKLDMIMQLLLDKKA